ncbi:hypothetical protein AnigIFM60653_010925 [Aspergillus niger]|nr:hypothetical protein AnigIFM60653_010925 [Aspergillus niger]
MSDVLAMPGLGLSDRHYLDPDIDVEMLEMMHGKFAGILLQLNRLFLPQIGSMELLEEFSYGVNSRPLSLHMNELVRLGTLPRSALPGSTFSTSSFYFDNLAELHIEHMKHQRNDSVESATDPRLLAWEPDE